MRITALASVGLFAGLALAPGLGAEEPYLALRTGLKCSQCHVNRTGGGGRNDFGSAWAQTVLPMRTVGIRSRALNDWISIGLDLRVLGSGTVSQSTPRTEIGIEETQLQFEARLIPNVLTFYVDEKLGPGAATAREAFALVEGLPLGGYAKAGKFMLPFGWRLWDDDAFIRSETRFGYRSPDQGIEVGIEPGPLSLFVAVSNGTAGAAEDDSDKQVTSSAVLVFPRFRIGASAARHSIGDGTREIVGGFGGFSVGPLTVLGEVDYIFNSLRSTSDVDQLAAYVEGNFLATKGLNVKVTYGYHDPNLDVSEDQGERARFGLEVFPVSFVQLSGFYTVIDLPDVTTDLDRISLELHLLF